LGNLEKSRRANPNDDFVLEGTVQNFNLTFDISWKVMKDILVKQMGVLDFITGSPRDTLQAAFTNELISDDEWIQMLRIRNQLAHDYDGSLADQTFNQIITVYYDLFAEFRDNARKYYDDDTKKVDSFG
jgi:nucleotidyltransferase substrate binding protein (TIGR01987 family)